MILAGTRRARKQQDEAPVVPVAEEQPAPEQAVLEQTDPVHEVGDVPPQPTARERGGSGES